MYIKIVDPGEPYQSFTLDLSIEDYISLFEKEIAFGKLLKIFSGLGSIIINDPKRLKEWVTTDPRYSAVIEVVDELSKCLHTGEQND